MLTDNIHTNGRINADDLLQAIKISAIKIEELELGLRVYNALRRAKIETVGDVLKQNPQKIKMLRNIGSKSLYQLVNAISARTDKRILDAWLDLENLEKGV